MVLCKKLLETAKPSHDSVSLGALAGKFSPPYPCHTLFNLTSPWRSPTNLKERDGWSITVAWLCLAALSALIACRMLWLYTPLWEWLGEEDLDGLHSADVRDSVRYAAIALAVALCVAICIAGARNASSQKRSEEEEEVRRAR